MRLSVTQSLGILVCGWFTSVAAAGLAVVDASFDDPANVNGYGPIVGWTQSPFPSGNPGFASGYLTGPVTAGSAFWDNGTVPGEGTSGMVGAIQAYSPFGNSTMSLEQTVSGFVAGTSYVLTYDENSRAGTSASGSCRVCGRTNGRRRTSGFGGRCRRNFQHAVPRGQQRPVHHSGRRLGLGRVSRNRGRGWRLLGLDRQCGDQCRSQSGSRARLDRPLGRCDRRRPGGSPSPQSLVRPQHRTAQRWAVFSCAPRPRLDIRFRSPTIRDPQQRLSEPLDLAAGHRAASRTAWTVSSCAAGRASGPSRLDLIGRGPTSPKGLDAISWPVPISSSWSTWKALEPAGIQNRRSVTCCGPAARRRPWLGSSTSPPARRPRSVAPFRAEVSRGIRSNCSGDRASAETIKGFIELGIAGELNDKMDHNDKK